jgi:hypothetical protein
MNYYEADNLIITTVSFIPFLYTGQFPIVPNRRNKLRISEFTVPLDALFLPFSWWFLAWFTLKP